MAKRILKRTILYNGRSEEMEIDTGKTFPGLLAEILRELMRRGCTFQEGHYILSVLIPKTAGNTALRDYPLEESKTLVVVRLGRSQEYPRVVRKYILGKWYFVVVEEPEDC